MDNKELQKTVNPVYLTAKSTLGLLKKAGDPDAVALLPIIGLETELQEKAKILPASKRRPQYRGPSFGLFAPWVPRVVGGKALFRL